MIIKCSPPTSSVTVNIERCYRISDYTLYCTFIPFTNLYYVWDFVPFIPFICHNSVALAQE